VVNLLILTISFVIIYSQFAFLGYTGNIDLKNPEIIFSYIEDYKEHIASNQPAPEHPARCFFGIYISDGNRRAINTYNLKKRGYLGTTSMDAELSLIMANQALARPGSFILDPFVGTGSFLFTTSHFGAFSMGSDIDGRQIRNPKGNTDVFSNVKQYNLAGRVLDTVVCDIGCI
jgi:tRNA (guanine10-N2)-methyltransferase